MSSYNNNPSVTLPLPLQVFYPSYDRVLEVASSAADTGLSSHVAREQFTGSRSFEHALELARFGDPELTEQVGRVAEAIRGAVSVAVPVPAWSARDVVGDVLDVPHHLAGQPDAWLVAEESSQEQKGWTTRKIAILVPTTYSWDIKLETVRTFGAAVAALVETLRTLGHIVTLDSYNAVQEKTGHFDVVRLQEAGAYLEPARLAFVLAHPSWLRRIYFALAEGRSNSDREALHVGEGYGRIHFFAKGAKNLRAVERASGVDKYDIVFPGLDSNESNAVLIRNVFQYAVDEGLIEADKLDALVEGAVQAVAHSTKEGGAK